MTTSAGMSENWWCETAKVFACPSETAGKTLRLTRVFGCVAPSAESQRDSATKPRHLRCTVNRFFIFLFTGFGGLGDRGREERVALFLETGQVAGFIIGLTVPPHAPDDTLPLVGQLTDGFMVAHFLAKLRIAGRCP